MPIEKVAVIGAGTMGSGIAQVCAQVGWETNLFDAFPEGLEAGMSRICLLYTSPSPRDKRQSRMPSSA